MNLDLQPITAETAQAAATFLASMPEGDRTFFKEPVDLDAILHWTREPGRPRWLAMEGDDPISYLAVIPGMGWSAHVGELRLIVDPRHRRRGLGSRLSRQALLIAIRMGLTKLTVEVVADKEADIEMFSRIGFEAEGLLKGHIRDRGGALRDLVVLSHEVHGVRADLAVLGMGEELEPVGQP